MKRKEFITKAFWGCNFVCSELWAIGFGVVILIFGLYLYRRYERFD
jgi:hypothetical protein